MNHQTSKISLCFSLFFGMVTLLSCQNQTDYEKGEVWTISTGEILLKNSPTDAQAQAYWKATHKVLPSQPIAQYVTRFRLFSDGIKEELGGMSSLNANNSEWEIALDTTDFNLKDTTRSHIIDSHHTLIHEFGHLLTLNAQQVKPTEDEIQNEAKGYLTTEGYAIPKSYLYQFITNFWDAGMLNKWDAIQTIEDTDEKQSQIDAFIYKTSIGS